MRTEVRFLLAMLLMLGVLVGTNLLFPPVPPPEMTQEVEVPATPGGSLPDGAVGPDGAGAEAPVIPGDTQSSSMGQGSPEMEAGGELVQDDETATPQGEAALPGPTLPEIVVEGPLYRHAFSPVGARLVGSQLLRFDSFTSDGPVNLLPEDAPGGLTSRILVGTDTVDLRQMVFQAEPAQGLQLEEGGQMQSLTFTYQHPSHPFNFQIQYDFHPDSYLVRVSGRAQGLDRGGVLFTDLSDGLAFNETDVTEEARSMAYVANHRQQGIRSRALDKVEGQVVEEGPFFWVAMKSKYFVAGLLAGQGTSGSDEHLGGLIVQEMEGEHRADLVVTQPLSTDGSFDFRLFLGPQDYAALSELENDFKEVNPYGWRFFRPIVRPFVAITITVLVFLHDTLGWGYGWVLILFGVLMRVLLFPLNHKAMRAQLKNMAVQPLLKDIQTRHKDNPEKMQKELMRLYKEHGFNPLAGCWPMLLPWPVLIALFFVFQNTIELRGVEFLWLPDLSAKDPFYALPVLLGLSMFFLQWVSFRTLDEINPQMKMMMWLLPIFMVVIFANLPSGLNLYYFTANVATLPQSWWIANERKKQQAKAPLKLSTAE
ncbi:MAG: membrane protein insertase YidC [Gemmatimonadota bacterium]